MGYKFLDHTTDAFIEVTATNIKEAFSITADAIINLTLIQNNVEEKQTKEFTAEGENLEFLLFSWIEEIIFVLITNGFAIRRIKLDIDTHDQYKISAQAFGEPLDFEKHGFKVEIKAPTFHGMEISQNGTVLMRFLLDL